jgi:hypothetical protein
MLTVRLLSLRLGRARHLSAYPRLLTSYSLFGQAPEFCNLEMHGPAYQTLFPLVTALAIIKKSRTLSSNDKRRHMSKGQRAMVAAKVLFIK